MRVRAVLEIATNTQTQMKRLAHFRVLGFWLWRVASLRIPMELFGALNIWVVRHAFGSRPWHGMTLVAYPPYSVVDLVEVVQALELIQKVDERRVQGIERHVRCIVLGRSRRVLSSYWPLFRVCHLTKLPFTESTRQFAVCLYAQELARGSTHGRLYSWHFAHSRANRQRIRSLCSIEAKRFLRRVVRQNREKASAFREYVKMLVRIFPGAPVLRPLRGRREMGTAGPGVSLRSTPG